jgi:hypothetical protein
MIRCIFCRDSVLVSIQNVNKDTFKRMTNKKLIVYHANVSKYEIFYYYY